MNADEKLAAAGLTDVEVIDHDAFARLPAHKRDVRSVLVQLPDPPPVAALRRIHEAASSERRDIDLRSGLEYVREQAAAALAEFDGTTS